jgi:hypothetical protein
LPLWYFLKHFLSGEFENIKEVTKIRKSKKDRKHNGQKKKDKRTHKNKDKVTRSPLKTGSELRCSGRGSSY